MRMRNIPVLLEHYRHQSNPPIHFALGFAAFICFYRHPEHTIQDDQRDYLIKQWEDYNTETVVHNVLCNLELWGTDLTALPGFANLVLTFVRQITDHGAWQVLNNPATFIHTNPTA
jgi:tagaturonate reductase